MVSFNDGEKLAVDAVVVSVGRRRAQRDWCSEVRVWWSTTGALWSPTDHAYRADGVWAVGDVVPPPPNWPTWASPRGSW